MATSLATDVDDKGGGDKFCSGTDDDKGAAKFTGGGVTKSTTFAMLSTSPSIHFKIFPFISLFITYTFSSLNVNDSERCWKYVYLLSEDTGVAVVRPSDGTSVGAITDCTSSICVNL